MNKKKIAIIIPRFFPNLAGGAERLALDYVKILKNEYEIEIFTSCAKDYITWKNELPAGVENWQNVKINRFKVESTRNIKKMNRTLDGLLKKGTSVTESEEEKFLAEQGPLSPRLVTTVIERQYEFDLAILVGYLYYPIVKVLPKLKIRKLIVPTFHEEPALSLPIYKRTFLKSYTYSFNTPEELKVFERNFGSTPNHALIGTYVDIYNLKKNVEQTKIRILTLGRMEAGKGFLEVFRYFDNWQQSYDISNIEWISIGSNHLNKDQIPACIQLKGFVSEEEKQSLIANSSIIVNPSPYESFSIAMMEAWSFGIPVLVNGQSEVMTGHNIRSQGGLHYSDEISFRRCLEFLIENPNLRNRLGDNGKKYVLANFCKEVVKSKLISTISMLLG